MAVSFRFLAAVLVSVAVAVNSLPVKSSRNPPRGGKRDVDDGRLAYRVFPNHYNLEVRPDIYAASGPPFDFTGSVDIYVYCLLTTNVVVLNARGLSLTTFPTMVNDPNSPVTAPSPVVLQYTFDPLAEFLVLDLTNQLVPGATYIIHLDFSGVMLDNGDSLYYDSYVDSQGATHYLAATQMEEIDARAMFPCFDEPDHKATFNITVVSQPASVTLSNTELIATEPRAFGWQANIFATTPLMSTYQVALVVGDFDYVEADWAGITSYPVRLYARPDLVPDLALAARYAARMQAWLEQETGIPYTLNKMDHIALPSKRGAMENWGLITYAEEYLCVNSRTTGSAQRLNVASVIAHELAHQWYGNLVTMKWWDDIWLNEGFATHYNYYPLQVIGWNGGQLQQSDIRRGVQQFFDTDQLATSDAVRKEVPTVWDAGAAFDGSTYPKGGAMVRQLKAILTEATFKRGLTSYLTKFSYGSATTDDLWASLSEQAATDGITMPDGSALDVKYLMDPWLNQLGYPIVYVSRSGDGTASVSARQFLNPRGQVVSAPSPFNYTWSVPLTIADATTTDWDAAPSFWLLHDQDSIEITGVPNAGDWFLVNTKQGAFYRVEYDSSIRADIENQLLANHSLIPPESRAAFIDDAFILTRSLNDPIGTAMNTTLYLANEYHYNPWRVMLKHFRFIDLLINRNIWYSNYRSYLVKQLNQLYLNLGWNYNDIESPLQQSLRRDAIINACYYGMSDCQTIAANYFSQYRLNPSDNTIVDPNNLPTVLCTGVAQGSNAEWSLVFNQYQQRRTSPYRDERWAFLFGLACSSDTQWHDRLLSYIIGGTLINTADVNQALFYMINNRVGQPIVWSYLQNTWNNVPSHIDKVQAVHYLVATWYDIEKSNEFNNFIGTYPPTTQSDLENFTLMDLSLNQNIDWVLTNSNALSDWLTANLPRNSDAVPKMSSALPLSAAIYWDSISPPGERL